MHRPHFLAAAAPWFSCVVTTTSLDAKRRATAGVRSVDPSSTMMISFLGHVCASADLTVSREQDYLRNADLAEMLKNCREAYRDLRRTAATSPHARFDIPEWMPLDA